MVCHTHYLHKRFLRRPPHGEYCQPLQTMLSLPSTTFYMHAINSLNKLHISHLTHVEQTNARKPRRTKNPHLSNQQIPTWAPKRQRMNCIT